MAVCNVCFRHCSIDDGNLGFCRARSSKDGHVYPINYGRITSLALDPIEKKPLNRFYPGSKILSVGSFGCNLRCPFCQNSEISWDDQVDRWQKTAESLSPKELADIAKECVGRGNIGVAFTYNEP
ncbi:MAG: radical SAM protein, partial [Lachnospiraceae bacterium]|nr:radical SAM protein [Lachnospiraceae bacterium]